MALDELPADVLDGISCFLTGWDLFQLSHVNEQYWHHYAKSKVWERLLSCRNPRTQCSEWKRTYAQTRSFRFDGLGLEERLRHGGGIDGSSGAIVQNPLTRETFIETFTNDSSFAFDVWFSLLDGERDGILTGGVLLGAQSPMMQTCRWTNHHVAFVAVDADRNLFCSVLDEGANCVATELDFGRWYHLALSFDRGVQFVYLDGDLVSELDGELFHSWRELSQMQVGTGFVSCFWQQKSSLQFGTQPRGVRTFCGWHNFHGVVDQFRVWQDALREEEVQLLAWCEERESRWIPWYSLQHSISATKVKRVASTRPSERIQELHRPSRQECGLESTVLEFLGNVLNYFGWQHSKVAKVF